MSGLLIRDARPADRAPVRELTLRAYGEYARVMEPEAWAELENAVRTVMDDDTPAERIVAEHGGRVVGAVMLFPPAFDTYRGAAAPPTWPEFRALAVAPEARGLGVGQALVQECIHRARRMGATVLGLHTSRSMRSAIRLYLRMGFVRAPETDFQPEGAELVEGYHLRLD